MAKEGWAWPALAKKGHYFVNRRSLCYQYQFIGTPNNDVPLHRRCKQCLEKLERRTREAQGNPDNTRST